MDYDSWQDDFNAWVSRYDRFDGFDRGDDGRTIYEQDWEDGAVFTEDDDIKF